MPEEWPAADPSQVEILVVGEVNPDLVVLDVPTLSFGQREDLVGPTTMTIGSSVAITACALARLGTRAGIVGVVGDDPFGSFMLARLAERGVAVDRVRTVVGGRTGSSVILVARRDTSDRQILTDPGVMGQLSAGDVDLARAGGVRHLHIGSWFLHTGAVAGFPDLLQRASRRGLTTSLDPNDDPARSWQSHLPDALPHVGTFFCNEAEAMGVAGTLGAPTGSGVQQAAREILARLTPGATLVLKAGADGAFAHTAGGVVHVPAPAVRVVDTVGAGDTLAAAFLHARLRGQDVGSSLRLAVAAGSLSTRRTGGVDGQPTTAEAADCAATLTVTSASAETTTPPVGGRARERDHS